MMWCCIVWYGTVWYGVVWYDVVCYGMGCIYNRLPEDEPSGWKHAEDTKN